MTQDKKTQNNDKKAKFSSLEYLLVLAGFILVFWGVGIEEDRDKMPAEQAKTELPSPLTSAGMIGAGALSLAAALKLGKKRDDEPR